MPSFSSILPLLRASRLHNSLGCGLVLLAGWPGGAVTGFRQGLPSALALGLICASAHLVNDLVDLAADRGNRPGRPLPAGTLNQGLARRAALFCLFSGLVLGLLVRPQWWAWWVFWATAGWGYSIFAKGRPLVAPFWTAAVVGSCWLAGSAEGGMDLLEFAVLTAMVWFLFLREIIKGIEDVRGDLLAGYATCAGRFPGNFPGLILLCLPMAGLGFLLLFTIPDPLVIISCCVFLVCLGLAVVFVLTGNPRHYISAGSLLKVGAFTGVAVLLAGRPG